MDYLGVYGPNAPPTIQAAFYTVVSSSNTLAMSTKASVASDGEIGIISSSKTLRIIRVELVAIEPDGKPVGKIATYKYEGVRDSIEKRFKVMGSFSSQGDKYIITPVIEPKYINKLKYVRLYVWRITTNGSFVEEGPQSWGDQQQF